MLIKKIKGQALCIIFNWYNCTENVMTTAKPNTQLGIPIVLKVSNDQLPRSTVEEVYTQIRNIDDALVLLVGIY
jgi:hypothetical protein